MARLHARICAGLFASWLALAALPAAAVPVAVSVTSGSARAGETLDLAVQTEDLTGLGVRAFQFTLVYDGSVATADSSLLIAGTLAGSAGWRRAARVTPGRIQVSAAGPSALSGGGDLIRVRFAIDPAHLAGGGTAVHFQSFLFNEGGGVSVTTLDGSITVTPTPSILVSPPSAEVVRGQPYTFSVSGSVDPPVSWGSTKPSVASISSAGILTGLAPGVTRVFAVDNSGKRDTTDGLVQVRGMGVTIASASMLQGQTTTIPITVTDLGGLGVRSGQITLNFHETVLRADSLEVVGTMLQAYGSVSFGSSAGSATLSFSGATDLTGSGTLARVRFRGLQQGGSPLTIARALFNETLPAARVDGGIDVQPLPSIVVSPDAVTMLAGETRPFTVSGAVTPPVTWSTLNPAIATVGGNGVVTAVAGGVTQVRARDAVGAEDLNAYVRVYDLQVSIPVFAAAPGAELRVPLQLDRDVHGLGIRSVQYTLDFDPAYIESVWVWRTSLTEPWGPPIISRRSGRVMVATAGATPLGAGGRELQVLRMRISPTAPISGATSLTLSKFLANEGTPAALAVSGSVLVRTVNVPPEAGDELRLEALQPDPFRETSSILYSLPAPAAARLAIYDLSGRLVRKLAEGETSAGPHQASWDGRDAAGRSRRSGIYFCRLESQGRVLTRRVALVR